MHTHMYTNTYPANIEQICKSSKVSTVRPTWSESCILADVQRRLLFMLQAASISLSDPTPLYCLQAYFEASYCVGAVAWEAHERKSQL